MPAAVPAATPTAPVAVLKLSPAGTVAPTASARVALLLVAAALLLIVDALGSAGGDAPATRPPQFEALEPEPGAVNVPGQATVAADLVFGWTGVLVVNGTEIPMDQLDYVRATARLSYSPADGKELRRLPGGLVRVTAIIWPITGTRARDAVEDTWEFQVT